MANDSVKKILSNFKNNIGTRISEVSDEGSFLGIDSSSGSRLYIIKDYTSKKDNVGNVVIDGILSESYLVFSKNSTKRLLKVPKVADNKLGAYHRRFITNREIYSDK